MKRQKFDLGAYRLVICLGPGGAGKTTLSAAIALDAAIGGHAVEVMTVDPAPRLLDALGVDDAVSQAHNVALSGLGSKPGGRLRARKLDPKRTFDALVDRYAPSDAAREAILANRIYRNLASALSGVADYMAMEQLLELHQDEAAEVIVIDTPPAREAIDFLDAPRRMLELLESRALTLLGTSRGMIRGPLGVFDLAARTVLAAFDRLTGLHLLGDVQAFVRSFEGMYGGFAERAAAAQALIRDEQCLIVLVTKAKAGCIEQAREFITALNDLGLRVGAVVVNRVTPPIPDAAKLRRAEIPAALKRKLARNLADFAALKRRETVSIEALRLSLTAETSMIIAPDLGHEPRSLKDLAQIAANLRAA
jgi:anion-transporting  ArsA/GET3 family ATPase